MAIALVGLPGAGKSAVGRRLADRLQQAFTDSDALIEQRAGCSIREIFEREGEARFRELEAKVLAELCAAPAGIVATGGGAVLRPENRAHLRASFRVFYLRATPEALFRRLRHDAKRPLLQVDQPLQRLRDMHRVRDPLYVETAHETVDTARLSLAALVDEVLNRIDVDDSHAVPPPP